MPLAAGCPLPVRAAAEASSETRSAGNRDPSGTSSLQLSVPGPDWSLQSPARRSEVSLPRPVARFASPAQRARVSAAVQAGDLQSHPETMFRGLRLGSAPDSEPQRL